MVKGSCLCGGVQYEIAGEINLMANCHCSMCRKHHGAAFVTFVGVNAADFRWVKGEDLLVRYQSSPGHNRAFCRVCGSSLPDADPAATDFFLPAGTLDDRWRLDQSSPAVDAGEQRVEDAGLDEFSTALDGRLDVGKEEVQGLLVPHGPVRSSIFPVHDESALTPPRPCAASAR